MLVNRREAANLMLASPFNESVAFACLRLGDQLNYTLPREEALMILSPRASVKRRTEFTLGRAAANLVVKQLVV
jgi:4'-phosphopantetheinyl transferase EntD